MIMIIVSLDKTGTMRPVVMLRVLRVTEDWAETPHTHRALSSRAQPSTGTRCTQGKQRFLRSLNCVMASTFCWKLHLLMLWLSLKYVGLKHFCLWLVWSLLCSRAGGGSQTFFSTHGNHLPSLSGVHGLKDFLHSDHLLEWFDGRIYSLKHSHKCKF